MQKIYEGHLAWHSHISKRLFVAFSKPDRESKKWCSWFWKCIMPRVWPEPIWIKVKTWWKILLQHQSTYLKGVEFASIESHPFRPDFIKFSKTISYEVNFTSQCSHLEVLLLSKFWDFNWCRFLASYVSTLILL